jgi:hypothetical protein
LSVCIREVNHDYEREMEWREGGTYLCVDIDVGGHHRDVGVAMIPADYAGAASCLLRQLLRVAGNLRHLRAATLDPILQCDARMRARHWHRLMLCCHSAAGVARTKKSAPTPIPTRHFTTKCAGRFAGRAVYAGIAERACLASIVSDLRHSSPDQRFLRP